MYSEVMSVFSGNKGEWKQEKKSGWKGITRKRKIRRGRRTSKRIYGVTEWSRGYDCGFSRLEKYIL